MYVCCVVQQYVGMWPCGVGGKLIGQFLLNLFFCSLNSFMTLIITLLKNHRWYNFVVFIICFESLTNKHINTKGGKEHMDKIFIKNEKWMAYS
jgi:hypothetical protein